MCKNPLSRPKATTNFCDSRNSSRIRSGTVIKSAEVVSPQFHLTKDQFHEANNFLLRNRNHCGVCLCIINCIGPKRRSQLFIAVIFDTQLRFVILDAELRFVVLDTELLDAILF